MKLKEVEEGSLVNIQFAGKVFKVRRTKNKADQRLFGILVDPDHYCVWCRAEDLEEKEVKKGSLVNIQFTGRVFRIRRDKADNNRLIGVSMIPDRYIVYCTAKDLKEVNTNSAISTWAKDMPVGDVEKSSR